MSSHMKKDPVVAVVKKFASSKKDSKGAALGKALKKMKKGC